MDKSCVHSCKGLCNALQVAEHREQEAIREYRTYASQCDYADVRTLLEDLIRDREKALRRPARETGMSSREVRGDRQDQRKLLLT